MEAAPVVDLKAFVPARNYEVSKQFYLDLGFTLNWSSDEISEFQIGAFRFLLQPWGLRVLYLSDPSGVLWHISEQRGGG